MNRFELEQHRNGHSSASLGKLINIDPSVISGWRNGKKKIRPESFRKLLDLGYDEKALIYPTEKCPEDELNK